MRERWERTGAITRLLMAIFGNLSRRAWWAYHGGPARPAPARTSIVARRPTERHTFAPQVNAAWQAVAAGALPCLGTAVTVAEDGDAVPVVWIDASGRPDIADLPRVLNASGEPPLLATQWLADFAAGRCLLVVTFVEPVAASWAVAFGLRDAAAALERIPATGALVIALEPPPHPTGAVGLAAVPEPDPRQSLWLPITSTLQLRAVLLRWQEQQP